MKCDFCFNQSFKLVYDYKKPPEKEKDFGLFEQGAYERKIFQCNTCHHFHSNHEVDLEKLYSEDYSKANYSTQILETFNKINQLGPGKSDNLERVKRITNYLDSQLDKTCLDIGSGLGVFPYQMKKRGWQCVCVEPDGRYVKHLEEEVGVESFKGDFLNLESFSQASLITFNRVLEHVKNPIDYLCHARKFMNEKSLLYIELPDGELAAEDPKGENREEFTVDHLHIFSLTSLGLLIKRAELRAQSILRAREPSGKYTVYAFATL